MQQLKQMAVFAKVVETGSISGAAEYFELSKSVISQHLKKLEQALGVELLKRTTRRQILTPAGVEFFHHCQQINTIAEFAWQQVQDSQQILQGRICITAPHALMAGIVVPAISVIVKQYPKVVPELRVSDQQLDLMRENIDLAIRVGQSGNSRYKQRRIGQFRDVLVADKHYVAEIPLAQASYIANRWQGKQISHQFRLKGVTSKQSAEQLLTFKPSCIADDYHSVLALLNQGVGIGLLPEFVLKQAQAANLVEVLPDYQLSNNIIYALHPYQQQAPLLVVECLAAIEQQLGVDL